MKIYLDRFTGAELSAHAEANLTPAVSDETLKANSRALLQALTGWESLTAEQEDAFICQIDSGEIDLDMRIIALSRRAISNGTLLSGDSQVGTVLQLLLPFAHQSERVMRHILYHHLPVDDPSVTECWHEHGLKLKGALFDSIKFGNNGAVIRPAEELAEPPSSMVWDLLCDDPRRDLSRPHQDWKVAADRLTGDAEFSSAINNGAGPTVQHRRMDKLLQRYPHFTSPECAKHFAECAKLNRVIWPADDDGILGRPIWMNAYAAFYPETIYDIKPYHMECWQALGKLDDIIADPVWQGKEELLESLLFSMHPSFQETPTQTILANLSKIEATINRDYPMREWSAAVG